jgi:glycosyltransferase involved in cell wall biosynthesis
MILAFELTWTGVIHAPGNSSTLQILAAACPGHRIRVHADPTHLEQLWRDPDLAARAMVEPVPVSPPAIHRGHTQIVSPARFAGELTIIRAAARAIPAGEPCLIFLLSATPTAIWAAALVARLHPGIVGVHVLLHGNLNDAIGWRTRNPLLRRFDLAATLRSWLPAPVRYIVYEHTIADALARIAPRAAAITDVVPLPVNLGDLPDDFAHEPTLGDPTLGDPIRVGYVGLGTKAKGFDIFLDVATRIAARHPGRVAFHLIGKVLPDLLEAARRAPLAEPPDTEPLSRDTFTARLGRLDFVMLPFRPGYYELSASGGLIDALTWLKPVLATDVPLMRGFVAAYGNIGTVTDDLFTALDRIVTAADGQHYTAQVEAMRQARALRTPAALAHGYRAALRAGFPSFPVECQRH